MSKGIYLFWDKKYEQVIYAGRFTGKKRIKAHFNPSAKYNQKINTYIQNHPERIDSVIFCEFDDISDNDLNNLEKETIELFKLNRYKYPDSHVFNFTDGGEGVTGYKKPYGDFEYTVSKKGYRNGKQRYCINDRDTNPIKQSINKEALDKIADALNNDLLTEEEAKAINLNPFKYTVSKKGYHNGEQKYCIRDSDDNPIKQSINKEALDEITDALNNGSLTEEEAKTINLNPFKYTVAKVGFSNNKQRYRIYDGDHNPIKQSINKEALNKIVDALNNGFLTEEEVKKSRGVKKILEKI